MQRGMRLALLRRLVAGEDPRELVAHRRARQRFGNPALEAVLRHAESRVRDESLG